MNEIDLQAAVNKFLPRRTGFRKQSAALARTVFQRRLASSLRAIRLSVQRSNTRLRDILDEVETLPGDVEKAPARCGAPVAAAPGPALQD